MYGFIFFLITSSKSSTWHAIYSCNFDRKLTITSQRTFTSFSNFDPDVLLRLITCHKECNDILNSDVTNVLKRLGHYVGLCAVTF